MKIKRWMAVLLSVMLVCAMLPASAMAEDNTGSDADTVVSENVTDTDDAL